MFLILFFGRTTILFGGRDTVDSFNGWFVGYEVFREPDNGIDRNSLAFSSSGKNTCWLESDIYMIRKVGPKLYVRGYSGDTVIDLYTNNIKQFRRNWGNTIGPSAERPENLKDHFIIFYKEIYDFGEFTTEEQEFLSKSPETQYEIKMSHDPYVEREIAPNIVMICIGGENQGKSRVQVVDRGKKAVLEYNLIGIKQLGGNIFLYGETGLTIINSSTLDIEQLVLNKTTKNHDMIYSINGSNFEGKYKIITEIKDYSTDQQKIFSEMKTSPKQNLF